MYKILLILFLFVASDARAIEPDKAAHFGLSYAATMTSYYALTKAGANKTEAYVLSVIIVNCVGLIKESTDEKFDSNDILANVAGSISVSIPVLSF